MFAQEIHHSTLLVYPYAGSFIVGLRYLLDCKKRDLDARFAGLPYRLRDIFKLLFNTGDRDYLLSQIEYRAFLDHAQELLGQGIKQLYSTDEYEVAAHILHNELLKNGVATENKCHGLTVYGPYVSAGVFHSLNLFQQKFYALRGNCKHFELAIPPALECAGYSNDKPVAVVYLAGNWVKERSETQFNLEENIIEELSKLSKQSSLDWMVKPHPDWSQVKCGNVSRKYGLPLLHDINELEGRRIIFINMLSSACFDLRRWGITLFVKGNGIDPSDLFGDVSNTCSLPLLSSKIEDLTDWEEFVDTHKTQLNAIYNDN